MPASISSSRVRFFANVHDSFNPHVSLPQQSDGLLAAGLSLRIRALGAEMELVLAQNFPVCLYACDASNAVDALRCDLILPEYWSIQGKSSQQFGEAEDLYREIRIENTLTDEHGEKTKLKQGATVGVIVEAD